MFSTANLKRSSDSASVLTFSGSRGRTVTVTRAAELGLHRVVVTVI